MSLDSVSFLSDIFGVIRPGEGSVFVEKSRHDRTDDVKLARFFKKKFGGDYIVLSDIAPKGVKIPDMLLTGRAIFENKSVSNNSSLDSQTRKALHQLDRTNLARARSGLGSSRLKHVLVVCLDDNCSMVNDEIVKIIFHRIKRYSAKRTPYINYVIVRKRGRIIFIWKYKKPREWQT